MKIRKFKEKDADEFSKIIFKSIEKSPASKEIIGFVRRKNNPEELIKKSKDTKLFLALINGKIVGGGGIKKNKIRTMFIDPKYQKKGIGKNIYERLEKIARENSEKKLWLHAAIDAVEFYEKLGFKKIGKDKYTNIKMEKILK